MVRGKTKTTRKSSKKALAPQPMHRDLRVKTELVKVADVVPYAKNARLHSDDQVKELAQGIAAYGFINPITINADGVIIAGHGRIMAAQMLGYEKVPAQRLTHLSPEEEEALRLFDNKSALNSKWDTEILAEVLGELKSVGPINGLHLSELTGFDARELRSIMTPKADKAKGEGYGGGKGEGNALEVVVTCETEEDKARLLALLNGHGFKYNVES